MIRRLLALFFDRSQEHLHSYNHDACSRCGVTGMETVNAGHPYGDLCPAPIRARHTTLMGRW